jgi:chemotaxis protein MotB
MAGAPGRGGEAARPIIVKKIKKGGHGHHGGAWKIAYADFVTAMMAFFLLMWLLGSTSKGDLNGIAEYFKTPMQVAMQGGSGSGDSSSVIPGGGQDLTRHSGQVKRADTEAIRKSYTIKQAEAAIEKEERTKLVSLKEKIEDQINSDVKMSDYKNQIKLDITTEGLRIQIVDDKNRPMFDLASSRLQPYTKNILAVITKSLNDVSNNISIAGHTDAHAYAGGEKGYSNWDLSADRANAARRSMIESGLLDSKILRVVGLGSSSMFNEQDPLDPMNRRISIVVVNKKTENSIRHQAPAIVEDTEQAKEVISGVSPPNIAPPAVSEVGAVSPPKPSVIKTGK